MIISTIVFLIGFLGLTIIPPGKIGIIERVGQFKYAFIGPKKKFLFPFIHQVILIDQVQTVKLNRVKVPVDPIDYEVGIHLILEIIDPKVYFYNRRKAMQTIKVQMIDQAKSYFMITKNEHDLKALEQELKHILEPASETFGFKTLEFHVTHINQ